MAYTTCSKCSELFHLRLTSEQALTDLRKMEKRDEVYCLACFKALPSADQNRILNKEPENSN